MTGGAEHLMTQDENLLPRMLMPQLRSRSEGTGASHVKGPLCVLFFSNPSSVCLQKCSTGSSTPLAAPTVSYFRLVFIACFIHSGSNML